MKNQREQFKRLLFWVGWSCLLIIGIILLKPFWTVAFVAIWILFGIIVYWADTIVEDEETEL